MLHEKIALNAAVLTAYAPDNAVQPGRLSRAVLLLPGGGYEKRVEKEREPIALKLAGEGIAAFVLDYSLAPSRYPVQLLEAASAIDFIRKNAERFHVRPDRVLVMGGSAGAHLAALLGVHWNKPWLQQALHCEGTDIRPDGMVLCYPVVTAFSPYAYAPAFRALLGSSYAERLNEVSIEMQAGPDTPPAFLWHTGEDELVPAENSLLLAMALRRAGVSVELHLFPRGSHGLGLADPVGLSDARAAEAYPECRAWFPMAVRWIRAL